MGTNYCSACGATLVEVSAGIWECPSCGRRYAQKREQTAEAAWVKEQLAQADAFLASAAFDDAYQTYESILTKDPQNVSARWGLVLSRFGIRYDGDGSTPTLSRMRYDSILDDPDYLQVIAQSDERARQAYTQRATRIDALQRRYLEVVRSERPYDVFISFKAEDRGVRTRDSVMAHEIYDRLTDRGLRVFYARVSLAGKAGTEYEPYIFAALQSAPLIILVATSPAHANAPWVKNEWSRFLALMAQDRDKHLLPVYEGMGREDFPQEIPVREAVDYAQPGALSDILQGTLTLTGRGVVADERDERAAIARLTDALKGQVERGEWQLARTSASDILDLDAENADAYFYLLLAQYQVSRPTMLADLDDPWEESRYYQRAVRYADPTRQQLLEAVRTRRDMRREVEAEQLAQEAERTRRANETTEAFEQARALIARQRYSDALALLTGPAHAHPEAQDTIEYCNRVIRVRQDLANPHFFVDRLNDKRHGTLRELSKLENAYSQATRSMSASNAKEAADEAKPILGIAIAMGIVTLLASLRILPFVPALGIMAVLGLAAIYFKETGRLITAGLFLATFAIVFLLQFASSTYEQPDPRENFSMFFVIVAYLLASSLFRLIRYGRVAPAERALKEFKENVLAPLEDEIWAEYVAQNRDLGIELKRPASAASRRF